MNTASKIVAKLMLVLLLTSISSSCATLSSDKDEPRLADMEDPTQQDDRSGYSAEPGDFVGVNFKSGQPSKGALLFDALAEPTENSRELLESDLKLLFIFPSDIPVRVVGFTDTHECSGTTCVELSLRRARYVHDWLISRGVPNSRLGEPYGFGSARPMRDNSTKEGRSLNRRAYISYGRDL